MSVTAGLEQQDDGGLPRFRVRLGTVLALLRVLAGRRGTSRARWWAGGFEYDLHVTRREQRPRFFDFDPSAIGHDQARDELLDHLSR